MFGLLLIQNWLKFKVMMKKDTYTKIGGYFAVLASLSACATTPVPLGRVAVSAIAEDMNRNSASQSALLLELGSLKAGEKRNHGDMTIEAGAIYVAASGSRCRTVTMTVSDKATSMSKRLACVDGQDWFFSKDVFLAGTERD